MALSDEQIIDLFNEACREKFNGLERFRHFARAIEAEVRKDDEALIRQMESALSWSSPHADAAHGWKSENWARKRSEAITAARARLLDSDLSNLTERGAKAWTGVDAQALREGRWYMVTHDGVATLCEDRRDAEKEAKDADMAWPHSGPHRAVQLVEASTAGFTAADMATASAQGFRDGVASLSANAGEPSGHIKEPYTLAEIKAKIASNDYSAEMLLQHAMLLLDSASLAASAGSEPAAWRAQFDAWWAHNRVSTHQVKNIGGFSAKVWHAAIQTVVGATDSTAGFYPADEGSTPSRQATHPSPPEGMVGGWMPIETAPKYTEHGVSQHLLLGYAPDEIHEDGFVSQGYWMEAEEDAPDNMGHDGGWVDVHFDFFRCGRSFGAEAYRSAGTQPTHWMPLPPRPTSSADSRKGE